MISNSLCAEEQVLFSSPESLEQLRVELLSMAEEHHRTAEQLPGELAAVHALLSAEPAAVLPLELLREAEFQLRERSACVVTLAQLAVRLVEGLRDQQLHHLHLLDRYEHEAETLRDLNDCLAHRNRHIETDVEYFREHLQTAESQLEHITALQIETGWSEKDLQIEHLEGELDRIRAELQYYRLATGSRRSIHSPSRTHLQNAPSEHCLPENSPDDNELAALHRTVQILAAENERLRRDCGGSNAGSRKSLRLPSCIREELVEQTERSAIELIPHFEAQKPCRRSPSIPRLEREHLLRDTSKSLLSPRSRFDNEEALCQTPSHLDIRAHALSSEWSTKSFDHLDPRPKLIFLQEEEEEKQRRGQETKETEESVREAEQRAVAHTGVNTDPISSQAPVPPASSPLPPAPSFLEKLLSGDSPLLARLCSVAVHRRIRRSILRANESLLMVGC